MPNLYPFQEYGVQRLESTRRMILGDEMGLGKTPQALIACRNLDGFPLLVVCPKPATDIWVAEAKKWLDLDGDDVHVYLGPGRQWALNAMRTSTAKIVITNYALFGEIVRKRAWRTIVFDEAHKFRNGRVSTKKQRNKKTGELEPPRPTPQLFAAAKQMPEGVPNLFLLTGSPVINDADDIWPLLHLIDPKRWKSYWTFANTYMFVDNNGFGWEVHGVKDATRLRHDIAPFYLRRLKADVLRELPAKRRQTWTLEMGGAQAKAYQQLAKEMVLELEDDTIVAVPLKIALITRLRQLLVTPLLLGIPDEGAAFRALRELLEESPHAAVVFTPFAQAIPHLEQYLSGVAKVWTISGKSSPTQLAQAAEQFNQSSERSRVLIATVQMATSWSATTASTCYFLEYDWAPALNAQAEDRLHRHGQTNPVLARYFVHKGTYDEHLMELLTGKNTIAKLVADPQKFLLPKNVDVPPLD